MTVNGDRSPRRTSRRDFLRLSGFVAGAAASGLLVACGGGATPPAPAPSGQPAPAPAAASPAAAPAAASPAAGAPAVVASPAAAPPAAASPAAAAAAGRPPKRGGTLRVGLNQESATIDPHKSRDIAGTQIKGLIYNQLIKYYRNREIAPDLAERWEQVGDSTYTFHLRKGVKFTDGQELTSADVKASYERMLNPETGSERFVYIRTIDSITTPDEYTVTFKLKQPQATFVPALALTGNYIAQKKKIDAGVNFETDVVGTGPFKLASRDIGVETRLERNPNFFQPDLPYLDAIVLRPYFDDSARLNALFSGDADLITYVSWAAMGDIEKDSKYILQSNKSDGWVVISFRVDRPPFNNVKLRQAINYAINRDAIIKTATSNRGLPVYGNVVPEWMWAFDKTIASTYEFNLDKAKQLVKEANAEGLKVEFTTWPPDTELFGRPSVVVANQLKQIGLDVTLKPQPVAEWAQTRESGEYQMFMEGNLYSIPDPDMLSDLYHSTGRRAKALRFADAEIDAWLDEARGITDQAKRKELYDKVQRKGLELAPYAWLFYREQGEATQAYVRGHEYLGSLGANNSLLETWLDK